MAATTTRKPRTSKPAPASDTFNIGGVEVTKDQIESAIKILADAPGIMVKQPLARAAHPLAATDYHSVAGLERLETGEATMQTKPAFIGWLTRLADDAA